MRRCRLDQKKRQDPSCTPTTRRDIECHVSLGADKNTCGISAAKIASEIVSRFNSEGGGPTTATATSSIGGGDCESGCCSTIAAKKHNRKQRRYQLQLNDVAGQLDHQDLQIIRRYDVTRMSDRWILRLRIPLHRGGSLADLESKTLVKFLSSEYAQRVLQRLDLLSCFLPMANPELTRPILCDALPRLRSLQFLSLDGNGLNGTEHAYWIAEMMRGNRTTVCHLETVILANNCLGDMGCEHIARALPCCKFLRTLNMCRNNIGDDGCKHIAHALPRCKSFLSTLKMSQNSISDDGAIAMARAIGKCPDLKILELESSRIGIRGCLEFAKRLRIDDTLKKLDLVTLPIDPELCRGSFCEALRSDHVALEYLYCESGKLVAATTGTSSTVNISKLKSVEGEEVKQSVLENFKANAVFHWLLDPAIRRILSIENDLYRIEFQEFSRNFSIRVNRFSRLQPGGRLAENYYLLQHLGILDPNGPNRHHLLQHLPESVKETAFCSLCWLLYARFRSKYVKVAELLFLFLEKHVTPIDDVSMNALQARVRGLPGAGKGSSSPQYAQFGVEMLLSVCWGLQRDISRHVEPKQGAVQFLEHLESIAIVLDFAAALGCITA